MEKADAQWWRHSSPRVRRSLLRHGLRGPLRIRLHRVSRPWPMRPRSLRAADGFLRFSRPRPVGEGALCRAPLRAGFLSLLCLRSGRVALGNLGALAARSVEVAVVVASHGVSERSQSLTFSSREKRRHIRESTESFAGAQSSTDCESGGTGKRRRVTALTLRIVASWPEIGWVVSTLLGRPASYP